MFEVFRCEMIKLKHTKLFLAVLLPAGIVNFVSLLMLFPKMTATGEIANESLQSMFYRQGNVLTILGPFMFALITGYIFSREYSDRTINQLFTYPVSRERIFVAKLCAVFSMILLTTLLSSIIVFFCGLIKVFTGAASITLFIDGLRATLVSCLLSFGTIPVAAAVSIVGKNVIPSMVLGTFASLITLVGEIGHGMQVVLFPWTTPYLPVRDFGEGFAQTGANPYGGAAIAILSVLFVASLAFCLMYYRKSEVHSGS